ncbi:hypothetical protein CI610_03760 [invertebrate metagenome]|uniref:Uncharacterized protein n=1 Tax=invertebrate metagenome TaxID=1711999 RepID=A0A2H9T279_9ZZZZ
MIFSKFAGVLYVLLFLASPIYAGYKVLKNACVVEALDNYGINLEGINQSALLDVFIANEKLVHNLSRNASENPLLSVNYHQLAIDVEAFQSQKKLGGAFLFFEHKQTKKRLLLLLCENFLQCLKIMEETENNNEYRLYMLSFLPFAFNWGTSEDSNLISPKHLLVGHIGQKLMMIKTLYLPEKLFLPLNIPYQNLMKFGGWHGENINWFSRQEDLSGFPVLFSFFLENSKSSLGDKQSVAWIEDNGVSVNYKIRDSQGTIFEYTQREVAEKLAKIRDLPDVLKVLSSKIISYNNG